MRAVLQRVSRAKVTVAGATTGEIAAGWLGTSYWALVAMSVATVGLYGSKPAFWPLPSEFLSGKGAAGGIAPQAGRAIAPRTQPFLIK